MKMQDVKQMLIVTAEKLVSSEERLCELDSGVGDGDHGVTVARGFKAVAEMLNTEEYETPSAIFAATGKKLSTTMGGAIGPILGSFFSGGAKKISESTELETKEMDVLFTEGLKRIQLVGGAKVGDRTLVDALAPAAEAMHQAAEEGKDLKGCLADASEAAWKGAESTKDMVAGKGRAKFLGEKSVGHVDAGATTMSLIIESMMEFAKNNEA